jgi:chromosome segregation ATPase
MVSRSPAGLRITSGVYCSSIGSDSEPINAFSLIEFQEDNMFMVKKIILGTAATAAVGALVFGRDCGSYMRTSVSSVREAIKSEVPLDFEIERAREMVDHLVPDIRNCMHVIAEEEVNVEDLNREITRTEANLAKQKDQILALRTDLGGGKSTYHYAGRTYTSEDVKRDLAQRFERFKTAEETLASRRQILQAREKSLVAAREKLDGMLAAKQNLEVQVENLDARLKTLQAAETASHVNIDDSQLARAKQLIRDINKQLDVKVKMLDAEGQLVGIPVDAPSEVPENLSEQIDTYFQRDSADQTKALAEKSL